MSVIVPCYNYGHYLNDTLSCVAAQSYSNLECVVIDDGSTDNTRAVVESFANVDNRFRYVHQQNQGLSAARNAGIEHSKGTLIQFLDSDDLLHSQKIEVQVQCLQQYGGSKVVFSDFAYFEDKDLDQTKRMLEQKMDTRECVTTEIAATEAMTRMTMANLAVVSGPLVPSARVKATGVFETSYRSLEDWNYWFRMAGTGTTFIELKCAVPMVFVRKHGKSMSRQAKTMLDAHSKLIRDMKRFVEKMCTDGASLKQGITANSRTFRGSIIFEEIQHHNLWNGLTFAISSAWRSPRDFFWYLKNSWYSVKVRLRK